MLRKLMWSGLYVGFAAGAAFMARKLATSVWRVATGEDPPGEES